MDIFRSIFKIYLTNVVAFQALYLLYRGKIKLPPTPFLLRSTAFIALLPLVISLLPDAGLVRGMGMVGRSAAGFEQDPFAAQSFVDGDMSRLVGTVSAAFEGSKRPAFLLLPNPQDDLPTAASRGLILHPSTDR